MKRKYALAIQLSLFFYLLFTPIAFANSQTPTLIPGGQSIGIKLQTKGVLVVGHHTVQTASGMTSPGKDAGIQVGDAIIKVNGQPITCASDMLPFMKEASLTVTILREDKTFTTHLQPEKAKNGAYHLGLYIRESVAGIGTLTFVDPKAKTYGALGHVIVDMDTKKPIPAGNGLIFPSYVTSIHKGSSGEPGEKLARFSATQPIMGTIQTNTSFGIFGTTKALIPNHVMDTPLPIAKTDEVKTGSAQILTVIEGNKVQAFDVEIIRINTQKTPKTKGMIIQITDPKLLEKTGGIIQGMSGSPIIQSGKLVGAVTHVLVNDPTRGYGVHISWMLAEAKKVKQST